MSSIAVDLELAGKTVLIVGASRGCARMVRIGLALGAHIRWVASRGETYRAPAYEVDLSQQDALPGNLSGPGPAPRATADWDALLQTIDVAYILAADPSLKTVTNFSARRACVRNRVWHFDLPADPAVGCVTLVGAGPGHPDLLTLGGRKALGEADVVLFDRLAGTTIPQLFAPGALKVDVGKRPGHHPISQTGIEELILHYAGAGANVVRLKGGDPFVFGRGGEEMTACRDAGIPVTVIPGISSALSVPALSGIPLTHRGLAHAFTVVSGHAPLSDAELDRLAGLGSTLVVLMGVSTMPHLAAGLCRYGMDPTTPAAIIERGSSPEQRTTITTVGNLDRQAFLVGVRSPAVIVIGEVVAMRESISPATDVDILTSLECLDPSENTRAAGTSQRG